MRDHSRHGNCSSFQGGLQIPNSASADCKSAENEQKAYHIKLKCISLQRIERISQTALRNPNNPIISKSSIIRSSLKQTNTIMEIWNYVEQVERKVDEIRDKALAKVQKINPAITYVVDNYSLDDYITKTWDYPGGWYCSFSLPKDIASEEELIEKLVRETLACHLK